MALPVASGTFHGAYMGGLRALLSGWYFLLHQPSYAPDLLAQIIDYVLSFTI
jgi:hypothetical protein